MPESNLVWCFRSSLKKYAMEMQVPFDFAQGRLSAPL
jgi:hypothetical protein